MRFEDYVAARERSLLRFAFLLSGDAQLSEDLVQTGLLKAYGRWRRVVSRDHPDAYVRRIIINAHIDWCRRLSNTEYPTDDMPDRRDEGRLSDPADRVAAHDELARALAQLRPSERATVVLRHYEGYTDAQIAAVLGCGEIAVRTYASRGLAQLRLLMSPTTSTQG